MRTTFAIDWKISPSFGRLKKEELPTWLKLGIGFVPFGPQGKGFLSGAIGEFTSFDSSDFRDLAPRLKESLATVDLELTPEDLKEIETALADISVQGDRYPEKLAARVNR
ncbi:aldo-keto reductase family protein [Microbulbifer hainanensis]|uniref:hypothetical protein n=1 Tax=Microbulbifer hainanensis TaxID=2735675 RepID=UPI0018660423|nr:hypothetical protein [Microbulbifer hainanensis]